MLALLKKGRPGRIGHAKNARPAGVVMSKPPTAILFSENVRSGLLPSVDIFNANYQRRRAGLDNCRTARPDIRRRKVFQSPLQMVHDSIMSDNRPVGRTVHSDIIESRPNAFHRLDIGKTIGGVEGVIRRHNFLLFQHIKLQVVNRKKRTIKTRTNRLTTLPPSEFSELTPKLVKTNYGVI